MNTDLILDKLKNKYENFERIYIKKTQEEETNKLEKTINTNDKKIYKVLFNELLELDFMKIKTNYLINENDFKELNNLDNLIIEQMFLLSILPSNMIDLEEEEKKKKLTPKEIKGYLRTPKRIKLHETVEKVSHILETIELLKDIKKNITQTNKTMEENLEKLEEADFKEYLVIKYNDLEEEIKFIEQQIEYKLLKLQKYMKTKQNRTFEIKGV